MIDARLPAHYDRDAIDAEHHAPWLMATLLEDGDTADLRWLVAQFGAGCLSRWVADRGVRQLSARSLAFWRLVLDVVPTGQPGRASGQPEKASEPRGDELWQR